MIKVNYTEWGLKHSFRRHHIEKGTIQRAISRGIRSVVEDPNNNSIIIFTTSKLAVAVDHKNNMKTAFWYRPNYYTNKMYRGKIIVTNDSKFKKQEVIGMLRTKIRVWYEEDGQLKYMDFDDTSCQVWEVFSDDEIIKSEIIIGGKQYDNKK